MCVRVMCVQLLLELRKGFRALAAGVTGRCELPDAVLGTER